MKTVSTFISKTVTIENIIKTAFGLLIIVSAASLIIGALAGQLSLNITNIF